MSFNAYPWARWIKWGAIVLVVIILLTSGISNYNSLAATNQAVESSWSQVENVMQRRADLITNLVEVVKGYVKHEEKVFGDVASARSVLMNNSNDVQSKLDADASISNAAKGVLLLVENYPTLKASEQFTNLQFEIAGSENRVSVERKRFIDSVQAYNTKIIKFPSNIFAGLMGFKVKDYYQASPGAKESPKISF